MDDVRKANLVRGKTIRFSWTDGPTKGETQEHVFHDDGSVEHARLDLRGRQIGWPSFRRSQPRMTR